MAPTYAVPGLLYINNLFFTMEGPPWKLSVLVVNKKIAALLVLKIFNTLKFVQTCRLTTTQKRVFCSKSLCLDKVSFAHVTSRTLRLTFLSNEQPINYTEWYWNEIYRHYQSFVWEV